jgi:hypothetical protein
LRPPPGTCTAGRIPPPPLAGVLPCSVLACAAPALPAGFFKLTCRVHGSRGNWVFNHMGVAAAMSYVVIHHVPTSDALKVFQAFPKGITALLLQYPYVQHGNRSPGAPQLA